MRWWTIKIPAYAWKQSMRCGRWPRREKWNPTATCWPFYATACKRIQIHTFGFKARRRFAIWARDKNSKMQSAFLALTLRRAIGKYPRTVSACSLTCASAVFLFLILGGLPASTNAAGRDGSRKRDTLRSGPRLKSDLRGEIPTRDGRG